MWDQSGKNITRYDPVLLLFLCSYCTFCSYSSSVPTVPLCPLFLCSSVPLLVPFLCSSDPLFQQFSSSLLSHVMMSVRSAYTSHEPQMVIVMLTLRYKGQIVEPGLPVVLICWKRNLKADLDGTTFAYDCRMRFLERALHASCKKSHTTFVIQHCLYHDCRRILKHACFKIL